MNQKIALVLGSSSWVAHYLIPRLIELDFKVIGISNSKNPVHQIENYNISILDSSFFEKLKSIECSHIINMMNSKEYELSYDLHVKISNYCKIKNIHYTFLSSANALDGDVSRVHYEDEIAFASSEYGKNKARCEHYLNAHMPCALIIRFAATHGYAPNRVSRTQEFLQKLKNGESYICDRGIFQNRTYVGDLAQIMAKIIYDNEYGIYHIGSVDYSEEFEFLKKLALMYGYSADRVISGEELEWNMSVLPSRILKKYGEIFNISEKDLMKKLDIDKDLQKFKSSN